MKASKPVITKVRQDEEKYGLRGLKRLGAVPAPTNNSNSSNAKSSSGQATSGDSSSADGSGGIKAPKPVTSLSKRSLKRARKLGLLTDEDVASAKQNKRLKPNNTLSGVDAKSLAGGGSSAAAESTTRTNGDDEDVNVNGSPRPASKNNQRAATGVAGSASAGSGTAAVTSAAPVRAQILAGQSLLEQDLRFVTATRKLGRGLQDGCVAVIVADIVLVITFQKTGWKRNRFQQFHSKMCSSFIEIVLFCNCFYSTVLIPHLCSSSPHSLILCTRYAQKRKTRTKLEARRPGESLLEFKRRTKKVTTKKKYEENAVSLDAFALVGEKWHKEKYWQRGFH